ncbi:PKD domain-containing protein [Thalassomonas actiniarum]|uniref:Alpha-amylase n=1 Tax=Thalassomonas actiniarum TaxID=485447 RepID=A0AAF0C2C7_9GAMM|nr:carbohydrate binding domain-containing protein [Thalassomonas actiniarum]WDD97629.1 alpha-amylase [Thalassomonas actiniarum]
MELSQKNRPKVALKPLLPILCLWATLNVLGTSPALAEISATHIYHNHMPNFWPYYDVSKYPGLAVGAPIRYTYDGQVINLKENPPANYSFFIPGSGAPMPHDDLVSYYSHHAKTGAYLSWPMDTANNNRQNHPLSQTHVTMSASVVNNVQSFAELGNLSGYNPGWGDYWRQTWENTLTANGHKALDTIHFTGHHSMGPLVGNDYFLKDLIYQNVTLAQDYMLGNSFTSSKGFFPTELGFSERIIPVLTKLGIEWSVLGNVHYSRTLRDYPYLNDPGVDTLISPPNRADLQNESHVGSWLAIPMFNEQQVTHNKFPFASIPHWVQYVDPDSGEQHKIAGIPVEQASSWEEGYQGSVTADVLKPFTAAAGDRRQYFVIAHDGDNSSGRAGDGGTWANSGNVTYADGSVHGMGVNEYLSAFPIPEDDIVHVQDGSWIDTRDSSADPTWYHWHLPMGVWAGQMADFNNALGTNFNAKRNHMVSMEYGYHYLERNFALLQVAENYAKTAEQIWLDANPDYWQPSSALDHEITYAGNQLNPWMMSYPVKGDVANNYAGGANPAELSWYFLIAAIDSGFGYYDENVDDGVKPTISFNQSLYFSKPYVGDHIARDKTPPSLWWPQRYPYNPGSANKSKAEGWDNLYADNKFVIYSYGFDASGITDIKLKVRLHSNNRADAKDKTFKLYDPEQHKNDADVDPARVGPWQSFAMLKRDLTPDINSVEWQPSSKAMFDVVPAQQIADLYYTYLDQFSEQLLDYYIEATDSRGNIQKTDIQQVYVGAGRYKNENGKLIEDPQGDIAGTPAFFTDHLLPGNKAPLAIITPGSHQVDAGTQLTLSAAASSDEDGEIISYLWSTGENTAEINITVNTRTTLSVTVTDDKGTTATTSVTIGIIGETLTTSLYYQDVSNWGQVCLHYSLDNGATWTQAPGVAMTMLTNNWFEYTLVLNNSSTDGLPDEEQLIFVTNDCNNSWDNNGGLNYRLAAGTWHLDQGTITQGIPDSLEQNQPPLAVISPQDQTIPPGTSVILSAVGSSDNDGTISGYLWSTGETTPEITVSPASSQNYTLTVTDDLGASDSTSVFITVTSEGPQSHFPRLYYRGTSNAWDTSAMELVSDHLWQLDINFDGQDQQRFKLDIHGDWSVNYGDNNSDGYLEQTGNDIFTDISGLYRLEVNDQTLTYRLLPLDPVSQYKANFNQVYFRGTANSWQTSAMELVSDHSWQLMVNFDGREQQRFKLDITGDWSQNYGDSNNDGYLEANGGDIYRQVTGAYLLNFNDETLAYRLIQLE